MEKLMKSEKSFELDAWTYENPGQLDQLIESMMGHTDPAERAREKAALIEHGGKAIGLQYCMALAKLMPNRLEVPTSVALTPHEIREITEAQDPTLLLRESTHLAMEPGSRAHSTRAIQSTYDSGYSLFARSSALDEDWLSGDAGVHTSKTFSSTRTDPLHDFAECNIPVVVMPHIYGVGLVVDVGYSELFERVVVRVAVGRATHKTLTSPTWDTESKVMVFDATGACLVPHHELMNSEQDDYTFLRRNGLIDGAFQRELVKALRQVQGHSTFGVQLELIGQRKTSALALVQVRPTPSALRGASATVKSSEGSLQLTTARVSKPFDISSQMLICNEGSDALHNACNIGVAIRMSRYHDTGQWSDPSSIQDRAPNHQGKILLWESPPNKYSWLDSLIGFAYLGVVGQLGTHLFNNTVHGDVTDERFMRSHYLPGIRALRNHKNGCTLEIDKNDVRALCQIVHERPNARLRMVSDGLVGQVFLLDA